MVKLLEDDGALKAQLDQVVAGPAATPGARAWYSTLADFLEVVRVALPDGLLDREFLNRLWDDNPVSAVGNGTVKVGPALDNPEFVSWFAGEIAKPLPDDRAGAEARLIELYDGLLLRLGDLCKKAPRLKLNRVLCAIFPTYFTTVADVGKLMYLHRQMGGSATDHPVHAHMEMRARIEGLLGLAPTADGVENARRMCIPWHLYERVASDKSAQPSSEVQSKALEPQPAALRRKGLTAMKGGFQTLLDFLPILNDGVTREEFGDLIRQANPDLAANSVVTSINVVSREFDLCKRQGDSYVLSARGINLLESRDPDELADHLLTRVFGVDHVLLALDSGPKSKVELVDLLKNGHPGWTTDFAPTSLLSWLGSLELMVPNASKKYELTERGRRWREMVTWQPEVMPKPPETIAEFVEAAPETVTLPEFDLLAQRLKELVDGKLSFEPRLLKQLHAGLWFHPIRHFAVLTGISGSGKTQLALQYARALCDSNEADQVYVRVVPVQPGWFDPGPLLGYVSPIQEETYRSAPFLDLLLRAADDPTRPYVAILDEMNLSHPEQYLAPILSAMETHGWIDLHQFSEGTTGVPGRVRYPANLAIVGTLNADETTHGLSDKVLDRAFTLEFWDIKVADFPGWKSSGLSEATKKKAEAVLGGLSAALSPVRLHFGWRTIDDVLGYLEMATKMGVESQEALDDAIYAKVLPKLRGEQSKPFEAALKATHLHLLEHGLGRCADKVKSLQDELGESGTARFWR